MHYRPLLLTLALATTGLAQDPTLEITPEETTLSWSQLPAVSHRLEFSRDLNSWFPEPDTPEVSADGSTYSHTYPLSDSPRRFFRLEERPPEDFSLPDSTAAGTGVQQLSYIDQGKLRRFLLWLPPTYTEPAPGTRTCDNGFPLSIICHGAGQTAKSFAMQHPDLITECAAQNVILVIPQGTYNTISAQHSWNSLDDPGRLDDVVFIVRLAKYLREGLWIDRDRIAIGGFSNGGNFSQRAVSRSPGTFSALAAIGSSLGGQAGNLNGPIYRVPLPFDRSGAPALIVNGRADTARPFNGGRSSGTGPYQTPVSEMVTFWKDSLRCTDPFAITSLGANGEISNACTSSQKQIRFADLTNMTHNWPDLADGFGYDANLEVTTFFRTHRRGSTEDTASTTPITLPATWRIGNFQGKPSVSYIPPAPVGLIFVAHDTGSSADFVTCIEMIEILESLATEGFGFFAHSSEALAWDSTNTKLADNADFACMLDLHAHLVSTTDITTDTPILQLGFGEGGHFAIHASAHLDIDGFDIEGTILLNTPLQEPIPSGVAKNIPLLHEPIFVATAENDTIAPPVPAWALYRDIKIQGNLVQQLASDYYPGRRKRLSAARFSRVPGVPGSDYNRSREFLVPQGYINSFGAITICPEDLDCATIPLLPGYTTEQEIELRKQLCVAFAGHTPDAGSLPQLRDFCIKARGIDERPLIPALTAAPADPSSTAQIANIPWTTNSSFQGLPARTYLPANPESLLFFFHGTSGGIDFYQRPEQREMIHALHAANIGIICTVSIDRDNNKVPGARWDTRSLHPDTDTIFTDNVDWVRLMALRQQIIATTPNLTNNTPLLTMGFSNGGGFALTFAHLAQNTPGITFAGAAIHAQAGTGDAAVFRAARRLTPGTPLYLTALANEGVAINMPPLTSMLIAQGHPATYHEAPEVLLTQNRFERLFGPASPAPGNIFASLIADNIINPDGLRQIDATLGFNHPDAEVTRQVRATIIADHVFTSRFVTEETTFFDALVP